MKYLLEQLRFHGLSFVLLGLAVWYFYTVNSQLQQDIKDCNEKIIEIYSNQQMQFREVIQKNTIALDKLTAKLDHATLNNSKK